MSKKLKTKILKNQENVLDKLAFDLLNGDLELTPAVKGAFKAFTISVRAAEAHTARYLINMKKQLNGNNSIL